MTTYELNGQTIRTFNGLHTTIVRGFGYAARRNRGRYAGQKVHRVTAEQVVAVELCWAFPRNSYAGEFVREQAKASPKPVFYASFPACGCTQGQNAAMLDERLSADDVTCTKCSK